MSRLVIESWLLLLYIEFTMIFRSFEDLHNMVRVRKVSKAPRETWPSHPVLCHAIDIATAFYFKNVPCLQRSAATTLLLRRHGLAALMVIGVQTLPIKYHAWVEIGGDVVNDKPYMLDIYHVMDRL
jgi:hypothetical protein